VAFSGALSSVRVITSSTFASVTFRGCPRTRLIHQAVKRELGEPTPPQTRGVAMNPERPYYCIETKDSGH
jgi:hypothetical protein